MAVLACTAGTTKPVAPAAARPADCRTSGCPLGETCVTESGCGAPWACQGCAMAYLTEARAYCGCDGRTIQTRELGCQTFAFAHVGACSATR